MNDEARITLAADYSIIDLNPCTFFRSREGMVGSKYNVIATVNHKPSKKNDGHYVAVNKSLTSRGWYKYDDNIVNLVKFVKGNTNSVLMDFQKTASILFYVDVKYVSICHNNLHNNDEVIDIMGHNRTPVIDQLQDTTSSSLSSNTLSSSLSNVSSPLSSKNSSRSLTSVRSKTKLDDNSLFPSSSQSTKNGKSNSSDIRMAKYFLSFCKLGYGFDVRRYLQYPTSRMVCRPARLLGGIISEILPCTHEGCTVRVHRFCQIDWLHRYNLEVVRNDPFFRQ